MSFIYKHHEVTGEMVTGVTADPDSASTPAEMAVLSYLTMPDEHKQRPLGKFVMGRFEPSYSSKDRCDSYHTGSLSGGDFQEIGRGSVVEDVVAPDGIYEVYVPI